jgi:hypothetical protein
MSVNNSGRPDLERIHRILVAEFEHEASFRSARTQPYAGFLSRCYEVAEV